MLPFKHKLSYHSGRYIRKYHTLLPWAVQGTFKSTIITRANNCYLYNKNTRIMDFTSGLMVANLGHNNSYIMEGFQTHLKTGIGYMNSQFETGQREHLSKRLLEITNNEGGKVFYTNGGADSNETAVFIVNQNQKLTKNNNKRKRVLSFKKSFHGGSTIGATLLSGDERKIPKEAHYSLNFESIMQNPSLHDDGKASLEQISKLFEKDDIAGIIIEGSSGSAGCILYPPSYLKKLEHLCRRHDILIICDEIMSGFGRVGSLFAYKESKIQPDLITIAKGFTGGYVPLGGVILSKAMASLYDTRPFVHGLTYFAHPLACNIANRCLDLYLDQDQKLIKDTEEKGTMLAIMGKKMEQDLESVKEYRSKGLLGCIELDIHDEKLLGELSAKLLKRGVFCFRRVNMLFTAPPLIVKREQLEETMDVIYDVLSTYKK